MLLVTVAAGIVIALLILADDPEGFRIDHYAIDGDDAVAVLWCTGTISHRGNWRSIAESLEFLPAAE